MSVANSLSTFVRTSGPGHAGPRAGDSHASNEAQKRERSRLRQGLLVKRRPELGRCPDLDKYLDGGDPSSVGGVYSWCVENAELPLLKQLAKDFSSAPVMVSIADKVDGEPVHEALEKEAIPHGLSFHTSKDDLRLIKSSEHVTVMEGRVGNLLRDFDDTKCLCGVIAGAKGLKELAVNGCNYGSMNKVSQFAQALKQTSLQKLGLAHPYMEHWHPLNEVYGMDSLKEISVDFELLYSRIRSIDAGFVRGLLSAHPFQTPKHFVLDSLHPLDLVELLTNCKQPLLSLTVILDDMQHPPRLNLGFDGLLERLASVELRFKGAGDSPEWFNALKGHVERLCSEAMWRGATAGDHWPGVVFNQFFQAASPQLHVNVSDVVVHTGLDKATLNRLKYLTARTFTEARKQEFKQLAQRYKDLIAGGADPRVVRKQIHEHLYKGSVDTGEVSPSGLPPWLERDEFFDIRADVTAGNVQAIVQSLQGAHAEHLTLSVDASVSSPDLAALLRGIAGMGSLKSVDLRLTRQNVNGALISLLSELKLDHLSINGLSARRKTPLGEPARTVISTMLHGPVGPEVRKLLASMDIPDAGRLGGAVAAGSSEDESDRIERSQRRLGLLTKGAGGRPKPGENRDLDQYLDGNDPADVQVVYAWCRDNGELRLLKQLATDFASHPVMVYPNDSAAGVLVHDELESAAIPHGLMLAEDDDLAPLKDFAHVTAIQGPEWEKVSDRTFETLCSRLPGAKSLEKVKLTGAFSDGQSKTLFGLMRQLPLKHLMLDHADAHCLGDELRELLKSEALVTFECRFLASWDHGQFERSTIALLSSLPPFETPKHLILHGVQDRWAVGFISEVNQPKVSLTISVQHADGSVFKTQGILERWENVTVLEVPGKEPSAKFRAAVRELEELKGKVAWLRAKTDANFRWREVGFDKFIQAALAEKLKVDGTGVFTHASGLTRRDFIHLSQLTPVAAKAAEKAAGQELVKLYKQFVAEGGDGKKALEDIKRFFHPGVADSGDVSLDDGLPLWLTQYSIFDIREKVTAKSFPAVVQSLGQGKHTEHVSLSFDQAPDDAKVLRLLKAVGEMRSPDANEASSLKSLELTDFSLDGMPVVALSPDRLKIGEMVFESGKPVEHPDAIALLVKLNGKLELELHEFLEAMRIPRPAALGPQPVVARVTVTKKGFDKDLASLAQHKPADYLLLTIDGLEKSQLEKLVQVAGDPESFGSLRVETRRSSLSSFLITALVSCKNLDVLTLSGIVEIVRGEEMNAVSRASVDDLMTKHRSLNEPLKELLQFLGAKRTTTSKAPVLPDSPVEVTGDNVERIIDSLEQGKHAASLTLSVADSVDARQLLRLIDAAAGRRRSLKSVDLTLKPMLGGEHLTALSKVPLVRLELVGGQVFQSGQELPLTNTMFNLLLTLQANGLASPLSALLHSMKIAWPDMLGPQPVHSDAGARTDAAPATLVVTPDNFHEMLTSLAADEQTSELHLVSVGLLQKECSALLKTIAGMRSLQSLSLQDILLDGEMVAGLAGLKLQKLEINDRPFVRKQALGGPSRAVVFRMLETVPEEALRALLISLEIPWPETQDQMRNRALAYIHAGETTKLLAVLPSIQGEGQIEVSADTTIDGTTTLQEVLQFSELRRKLKFVQPAQEETGVLASFKAGLTGLTRKGDSRRSVQPGSGQARSRQSFWQKLVPGSQQPQQPEQPRRGRTTSTAATLTKTKEAQEPEKKDDKGPKKK